MSSLLPPVRLRKSPHRIGQVVLAVTFLVIIYLPGVGMMIRPPQAPVYNDWSEDRSLLIGAWHSGWEENRPLPKLTWRLSSILSFPRDFEEYFRFNFAFRRNLIRWRTKLVGKAASSSGSPAVVEGKQGWLFLGEHGTVQDYRGMLPFTGQQLQDWQRVLESRRDWLAEQGIHYLFVICPDKHTIYPEYMPDKINRVHVQTRLDQFVRHMKEHSDVEILDLRPALLELKSRRLCYQPQETHWNGVGAFAAYQQIAQRLRTWYPDLHVIQMDECEIRKQENKQTDLLRLLGKTNLRTVMDSVRPINGFTAQIQWDTDRPHDRPCILVRSRRREASIGRALVVCDSFSTLMIPFLAEHFGDALYVWGGGDGFLPADVLGSRPDVVIQEIVERAFCETTPNRTELPPLPAGASAPPTLGPESSREPP